ncbi:hypothetical protein [Thiomicrorhabdus sp. 6S3-12]|uniref:hypothetical protein n=1 Tax=Thiomicrorhabdus sp. 6S3-12 TaxID=2819681 RepID=UPI001AAD5BE5|nr:hypothetical protein [Thiomicrorhabdus sp. 6S3-12]MBO1923738.1 hypothetical protein [Thiomicrorhabdus sp. 6S3-12]
MINVINIGGWNVGNGAIVEWLDSIDQVARIQGEFNITRAPGGVLDLLAEQDSERKERLIKALSAQCNKGMLRGFKRKVRGLLFTRKRDLEYKNLYEFHRGLKTTLLEHQALLKSGAVFDEFDLWRKWLASLAELYPSDQKRKVLLFQNPFFYDETFDLHSKVWPELFNPYKLIFVHRDPLDQWSDIVTKKEHLMTRSTITGSRPFKGTEEMHPADRFLHIAKNNYLARLRMAKEYTRDNLIVFSFEDFINSHDFVTRELLHFLDVEQSPRRQSSFDLSVSRKNIGIGKNNAEALQLLEGKDYVLEELYELRDQLINTEQSIKAL